MTYAELMRITVLLTAGVGTVLGALTVIVVQREPETLTLIVGAAWWLLAGITGLVLGRQSSEPDPVIRRALASARTATSLPSDSPGRIALTRLWPIGAFALLCGLAALIWPQVAAIGAGYAILIALAWRNRESAIEAIEDRDGVKFYVVPTAAHRPIELIRSPGLYRL